MSISIIYEVVKDKERISRFNQTILLVVKFHGDALYFTLTY